MVEGDELTSDHRGQTPPVEHGRHTKGRQARQGAQSGGHGEGVDGGAVELERAEGHERDGPVEAGEPVPELVEALRPQRTGRQPGPVGHVSDP